MASQTSSSRRILITGANRGIGFAILQALATEFPDALYFLAARDVIKGEEALADLRTKEGIKASTKIEVVGLDVENDETIKRAVETVKEKAGGLDVLINNAGIGIIPTSDPADIRAAYARTFSTNVASIAVMCSQFLPLLQSSSRRPQIINISSARGSLHRSTTSGLPPTASVPYSISKTTLNALTIELEKAHPAVVWQAASPGHCATSLNGFRGKKEPIEGAKVVTALVRGGEGVGSGFWEFEDGEGLRRVPW